MNESLVQVGGIRQQQEIAKAKNLADVEKKIEKLEERLMNDEIETETYRKYYKKFKSERRACLRY